MCAEQGPRQRFAVTDAMQKIPGKSVTKVLNAGLHVLPLRGCQFELSDDGPAILDLVMRPQQVLLAAPTRPGVNIDAFAIACRGVRGKRARGTLHHQRHPKQVVLPGIGELYLKALRAKSREIVDHRRGANEIAADGLIEQIPCIGM